MIYRIKVEGKEYNENYTFETPKEGDILDELKAIVEDMKEGNIDKLEVEREAQKHEGLYKIYEMGAGIHDRQKKHRMTEEANLQLKGFSPVLHRSKIIT